jgi:hypothetical protein
LNYRHQKVSKQFIPDGGTVTDAGVSADFLIRHYLSISGSVQYEAWNFPVISPIQKTDVSTGIQFTLWPEEAAGKTRHGKTDLNN